MKKQKKKIPEFVIGEKLKDVKVSEKQHFLLFVSLLVFFNLLLYASLVFLLVYLNNIFNWIISGGSVLLCGWLSFKMYRDLKSYHKCEVYNNALVVNSIWLNVVIPLENIYEIKVKKSFLDSLFKMDTYSLEFHIMKQRRTKFTLFFVEEDANLLKDEILKLINQNEEKINIKE